METSKSFSLDDGGDYDYIISGAGCAGLSLVIHLIHSGKFYDKRILIVDKEAKQVNDRTWCFWEKGEGLFQPVVYKEWKQLLFHSKTVSKKFSIQPYTYKLIRGIDFYNYCLEEIKQHPNITFLQAAVESIFSNETETGITAEGKKFTAQYIFNSILFQKPLLKKGHIWLLQHFKGWFIKTKEAHFDASVGTLMDFRTDQSAGTTFFYVLPFCATEALVEYTLFSPKVLADDMYEKALEHYVQNVLNVKGYEIVEKEFGVIPMTNYSFTPSQNNIINIGTAGGQTKGSSGYTFQYIQKNAAAIRDSLIKKGHPFISNGASKRFRFYDSVLLNILQNRTLEGDQIFTDLFRKNDPRQVLKFLDNETSLAEDLGIISSLPTAPFSKAAIRLIRSSF